MKSINSIDKDTVPRLQLLRPGRSTVRRLERSKMFQRWLVVRLNDSIFFDMHEENDSDEHDHDESQWISFQLFSCQINREGKWLFSLFGSETNDGMMMMEPRWWRRRRTRAMSEMSHNILMLMLCFVSSLVDLPSTPGSQSLADATAKSFLFFLAFCWT